MNLHSHKLILKAVLGGLVLASAVPADAGCHSRSSGHSYGSSHSSHQAYSRPVHSVAVYHKPVYREVYQQPVYQQPVYQQPVYPQPTYPQPQPVYSQAQPQYGSAPPTVTVSSQQSYPVNGQPLPVGSMPGHSVGFPGTPVSGSAFPVSAPAPAPNQIPEMQSSVNGASGNGAPVNAAPVNPAIMDAQQSALQALGGFAPPDAVAAQSATNPQAAPQMSLAGVWTAQLANGSRVQLSLQADGNFSWTAVNKDGQSSVFQGKYAMQNGSLSLTRGNDGQKLDGTMTLTSANTFSFQLTAAQSASLDFVRG